MSTTNNLTTLVDALRSGSDLEASILLARLRLGEPLAEIIQDLTSSAALPLLSDATELSSPAAGISNPSDLVPRVDRAAEDFVVPVDIKVSTISNTHEPFLSVLFERNELKFLCTLEDDGTSTSSYFTSNTAGVSSSSNPIPAVRNDHLLESCITPRKRARRTDSDAIQMPHAMWAPYPKVRDGIVACPLVQLHEQNALIYLPPTNPVGSLIIPSWAMKVKNVESRSNSMNLAFSGIQDTATQFIERGITAEEIFGSHPDIAALLDEKQHNESPVLSQWAASMVHSVKLKGLSLANPL